MSIYRLSIMATLAWQFMHPCYAQMSLHLLNADGTHQPVYRIQENTIIKWLIQFDSPQVPMCCGEVSMILPHIVGPVPVDVQVPVFGHFECIGPEYIVSTVHKGVEWNPQTFTYGFCVDAMLNDFGKFSGGMWWFNGFNTSASHCHVQIASPVDGDVLQPGDGNYRVEASDLIAILARWGTHQGNAIDGSDLNMDGTTDIDDLLIVLGNWGQTQ